MRRLLLSFIVTLFSAMCTAQTMTQCNPANHRVLSELWRSTGYDTRPTDTPACDSSLKKGWYRFNGLNGAAVEMATSYPGKDRCGTSRPIWIDGPLPTAKYDLTAKTLCRKEITDDQNDPSCTYFDEVFVIKCDGFYIFKLDNVEAADCPSAFCAGTANRCPIGKWSTTGFEPCRDPAPELTTPPEVIGPIVYADQSFDFQCKIPFAPNDPDQVFEVLWTFNGQSDPAIGLDVLTGAQKVATLSGEKLKTHIDQQVACQVTAYYQERQQDKKSFNSNPFYFGVQSVELTGPRVQGNSFNFVCDVTYGSDDNDQKIEVRWTFNGVADPNIPPEILTAQDRTAVLDGKALASHLNSEVGCEARLIYEKYDVKSVFQKSNLYYAGIKFVPGSLQIGATESEKEVTVVSTLPIVCNKGPECCLTFKMEIDDNKVVSLKNSCDYKICSSDWDSNKKEASIKVTVVPSRAFVNIGSKNAVLSVKELVISGRGQYIDVFKNYKPAPLPIQVNLEGGFKCAITGDPHINLYDYKGVYHFYVTGDFIAYKNPERDFMVQIRTWPCWAVTCVCGLIVKERNDIVRVHGCDKPGLLTLATVDSPYPLSDGVDVRRSANGQHVGIVFGSGSEISIDIDNRYMNVYIFTPATDKGKATGMCGTNDGNEGNDFTLRDGSVITECNGHPNCYATSFYTSWSVSNTAESMFVVSPAKIPDEPPSQTCSCKSNAQGKLEYKCSPRQHLTETGLACTSCQGIKETLTPFPWGQPGFEEKPFVHQDVAPIDFTKTWPNKDGITEAQARDLCTNAIHKSQVYDVCKTDNTQTDKAMSECLSDILHGGTTMALDAVTASFTSNCQFSQVANNVNINKICPMECTTNGNCGQNGMCVCKPGWEGDTCQIQSGIGPQITPTTEESAVCDTNIKPCDSAKFDKTNVDIHDNLTCRVQPVDDQGNTKGNPIITAAVTDSSTVTCPLPKSELATEKYVVAVSTDGTKFGNEQHVLKFDSTCLDCTKSSCVKKTTACHINNVCYKNGERNKNNEKQFCDPENSTTEWTSQDVSSVLQTILSLLQKLMQQVQRLSDMLKV